MSSFDDGKLFSLHFVDTTSGKTMQTKTKMRITPYKALLNADPIVQKLSISQKEFVHERHVDSVRRVDPC